MYCSKCETKLTKDSLYCKKCGTKVDCTEVTTSEKDETITDFTVKELEKQKFSYLSLIALLVSLLAAWLYSIQLKSIYILWIVMSIVSIILPIPAKILRIRQSLKGKILDVAAIVVGSFDIYFFFFAATHIPMLIAFVVIGIFCVIYANVS